MSSNLLLVKKHHELVVVVKFASRSSSSSSYGASTTNRGYLGGCLRRSAKQGEGVDLPNMVGPQNSQHSNNSNVAGVKVLLKMEEKHAAVRAKRIAAEEKHAAVMAAIEAEMAKMSLKHLRTNYPFLIDRMISGPSIPKIYNGAKVIVQDIPDALLLRKIEEMLMNKDFWSVTNRLSKKRNCDCENEVVGNVCMLLECVLEGLKLDHVVEVCLHRTLAGSECDILLTYVPHHLPFAVLEIKKPPRTEAERNRVFHGDGDDSSSCGERGNRVAGELLAEMKGVQLFGFDQVFGMISTGNQWRLVSTHRMKRLADAESESFDEMKTAMEKIQSSLPLHSQPSKSKKETTGDGKNTNNLGVQESLQPSCVAVEKSPRIVDEEEEEEMILYGSHIVPNLENVDDEKEEERIVRGAGKDILQLVTLFILQACTTLRPLVDGGDGENNPFWSSTIPIHKNHGPMPCRVVFPNTRETVVLFSTISSLNSWNLNVFTPPQEETIYIIRHLGMGGTGNCCLGVSGDGSSTCVVKFYIPRGRETKLALAKQEHENWKSVYGTQQQDVLPMSWILDVAEGACLIMPYLHPIPPTERRELLENGEIRTLLETFGTSGYQHLDIQWRHFVRLEKPSTVSHGPGKHWSILSAGQKKKKKKNKETNNKKDEWIEKALQILEQSAGVVKPVVVAAQTPPVARRRQKSKRLKHESMT